MKKQIPILILALMVLAGMSGCKGEKAPYEYVLSIGQKGTGPGEFQYVEDFAIDSQGRLLVTDALNSTVQIFTAGGEYVSYFGGKGNSPLKKSKSD